MKHVGPERAELHRQLWAAHCAMNTHEHVNARVDGVFALRDALARHTTHPKPEHERPTSEEEIRELQSALAAAERCGDLSLHVICALARVEELRATLNELAEAVGRENYREAIDRARELRALAPPEHVDDP